MMMAILVQPNNGKYRGNALLATVSVSFAILVFAPGVRAQDFVIDDRVVSNPSVTIADPEFDNEGYRMALQDGDGNLWVATVDPVTGSISPRSGRGTLVDTGLAPLLATLNGPEWAYGADGIFLVYTKLVNSVLRLGAAIETAPNVWSSETLAKGGNRYSPLGSPTSNLAPARIVYYVQSVLGPVLQGYRSIESAATEEFVNAQMVRGGRWGEAQDRIVTTAAIGGVHQVVLVDSTNGGVTQVTSDSLGKSLPSMWYAPEYDDYLILAMIGTTEIGIYRDLGAGWVGINTIILPSPRPLVHSPEPFVYNGSSYIVVVACDTLGGGVFPQGPSGPTDIWIAGIDPSAPFFRQVSSTNAEQNRIDPEAFILEGGPAIFYTEIHTSPSLFLLRRAATGL